MSQLGGGEGSCIPTGKRNKVKDWKAGIRKFNTLDEKEKVPEFILIDKGEHIKGDKSVTIAGNKAIQNVLSGAMLNSLQRRKVLHQTWPPYQRTISEL